MSRRAELLGVGVVTLGALAFFLLAPTYPNYDAYYHLVWGRELLDGQTPTLEAYKAPTQHPLEILVAGVLGAILGTDADRAFVLIAVLSLVSLGWAVYRMGARIFGVLPGVAAAFFTLSSFSLLLLAARGYRDVPFLALVFWAGVRVVEKRDDRWTMVLLVLAGLLRPEAWILAGLFALWSPVKNVSPTREGRLAAVDRDPGPHRSNQDRLRTGAPPTTTMRTSRTTIRFLTGSWRRSVPLLAAAAVAPLAWAGVDLAVTGDPLRSLTGTSELAEELGRERGIAKVPGAFFTFVVDALRLPVAAMAAAGFVLAWRRVGPRRLLVPLALLGAGVLTFVGTGIAGLSILPRYLTVPTVALTLFAGYALAGFVTLPPGRTRKLWTYGAAVLLAGGFVFVAARAHVVKTLTTELAFIDGTHADLVAILDAPEVRAGARCGPITFPNYRLVPDTRWILGLPADRVGARSARRHEHGVAIFVIGNKSLRRYGFADGASPSTNAPDPGFELATRRGRFVAYVSCPPGTSTSS